MKILSGNKRWALLFLLLLLFLLPVFEVKTLYILGILLLYINNIRLIPKFYIHLILFLIFSLAYLITPYWNIVPNENLKIFSFTCLFILGFFWSYFSSGELIIYRKIKDYYHLLFLTLMIYLINYFPLGTDIPWRGDEDLHIKYVLDLYSIILKIKDFIFSLIIKNIYPDILILSAVIFTLYYFKKKFSTQFQKREFYLLRIFFSIMALIIPISALILFSASPQNNLFPNYTLLRYPFLEKWFNLFFTIPYQYADIKLFLIMPFLSTLFLGWYLYLSFTEKLKDKIISLLLAFSLISLPIIYFYSSLLYLEMPIILLLTICIFDVKSLLLSSYRDLIKRPSWYCLLLISFLKDTVLIFLAAFVILRVILQIIKQRKSLTLKGIIIEILISFLIIFPYLVYFIFKTIFLQHFDYGIDFSTFFNPFSYKITLEALLNQFGVLFPLAVLGLYTLYFKRKFLYCFINLLFIGLVVYVLCMTQMLFLGYSRRNLFLYPMFLYLGYYFIIISRKEIRYLSIILLLIFNIILSPIRLDGIRTPNWGSPLIDTAEYIYPYEKAIIWLKDQNINSFIITGSYYPYTWGFNYYFGKYQYQPQVSYYPFGFGYVRFERKEEYVKLDDFFEKAQNNILGVEIPKSDTVLYHSVNNLNLDEKKIYPGGYRVTKRISNYYHSLYIFKKLLNY